MNTLFDKIWDKHVVQIVEDGPTQLYIDRLYCHEVTSPQAFAGMRARGLKMFRPDQIFCMPDHNTPTHDQDKPIEDPISKKQVDTLAKNTADFGVTHFAMNTKDNGIIHVVGPEKGLSLPGMTIVCGDSHTSTHGAMGAVVFGIGTSEVEMVMASQCIDLVACDPLAIEHALAALALAVNNLLVANQHAHMRLGVLKAVLAGHSCSWVDFVVVINHILHN